MSCKIECQKNLDNMAKYINHYFKQAGKKTAILGLSGGLDSAVVAQSLCKCRNIDQFYFIHFANFDKDGEVFITPDVIKVNELVETLKNVYQSEIVLRFESDPKIFSFQFSNYDKKLIGNYKARSRMATLYAYAEAYDGLVVGTTNMSEYITGYYTKWGDGCADLEPLIGVTKSVIMEDTIHNIGIHHIPEKIAKAAPSAGLWEGQTDESEMGLTYKEIDEVIYYLYDVVGNSSFTKEQVLGRIPEKYKEVMNLHNKNKHKNNFSMSYNFGTMNSVIGILKRMSF